MMARIVDSGEERRVFAISWPKSIVLNAKLGNLKATQYSVYDGIGIRDFLPGEIELTDLTLHGYQCCADLDEENFFVIDQRLRQNNLWARIREYEPAALDELNRMVLEIG